MDKYLQQILNDVNTIIIPGLGALTITNKSTGEIMFMGFLKHDDGNLARYITEKEGLSENDAKNMIAKYVREIQAKLDAGESYDMYRFGRFVKKNGEIEFESWNENATGETESKNPEIEQEAPIINLTPAPEPVVSPEPEPVSVPEPTPVVEEKTKEPEVVPPVAAEPPKTEAAPVESNEVPLNVAEIKPDENVYIPETELAELKKQQAATPPPAPSKEAAKKAALDKKASTQKTVKPPKTPKAPKVKGEKKRSPMFWVLIVLGILLLGGGGATAIFFKEVKAFISGEKPAEGKTDADSLAMAEAEKQEQEAAAEKEAELAAETTPTEDVPPAPEVVEEVAPEPAPAPEPGPTADAGSPFHIIAGGFANESNATRFAEKLKGEGKQASVLGKFDELYLVSAGAYGSRQDAVSAMQNGGIKGWVFKYPK